MKQLSVAIWQQSTYIAAICSGREQIKQTLDKGSTSPCRNLEIQPEILYVPGLLGKHSFLKKPYACNSLMLNNPKACRAAFHSLVCLGKVSLLSLHNVDGWYRERRKCKKKKQTKKEKKWDEKDIYTSWLCHSPGIRKQQRSRNSNKTPNPSCFCCALQKVVIVFNKHSSKMFK